MAMLVRMDLREYILVGEEGEDWLCISDDGGGGRRKTGFLSRRGRVVFENKMEREWDEILYISVDLRYRNGEEEN